jgi:hypothetical protein
MGKSHSRLDDLAPRSVCVLQAITNMYISWKATKLALVRWKQGHASNKLLDSIREDLKLMLWVYSLDFSIAAVAGKSVYWSWTPNKVLWHHFPAIITIVTTIWYDILMCKLDPYRDHHKSLRGMHKMAISGLVSCVNEAGFALLATLPHWPGYKLRLAQRCIQLLNLTQLLVIEIPEYYTCFIRRVLKGDNSLEWGEAMMIQAKVWGAIQHYIFLKLLLKKFLEGRI